MYSSLISSLVVVLGEMVLLLSITETEVKETDINTSLMKKISERITAVVKIRLLAILIEYRKGTHSTSDFLDIASRTLESDLFCHRVISRFVAGPLFCFIPRNMGVLLFSSDSFSFTVFFKTGS